MHNEEERKEARILSSLGLCARARRVIFGVPMICEAMRRGEKDAPCLVLEAADTSDNTHKKITDKCTHYGVACIRLSCDGATLAQALGKSASLAAVAITDARMAEMVKQSIR